MTGVTPRQLFVLAALLVAITLLVIAVLPAEHGVDPTGIGPVLGLTSMGEIKLALAREAAADAAADLTVAAEPVAAPVAQQSTPTPIAVADTGWRDVTVVSLAPGEGTEVKLVIVKGARAEYEWAAVGAGVIFDMHGDASRDAGELIAAMDGSHGWFWRNRARGVR